MSIEIQEFDAQRLWAVPHKGPYQEIGNAFDIAMDLGRNHLSDAYGRETVAIYYDDPQTTAPENLRSHACIRHKNGDPPPGFGMEEVVIPASTVATRLHVGSYENIGETWKAIYAEDLPSAGLEKSDKSPYEIYINSCRDTETNRLRTLICVPID